MYGSKVYPVYACARVQTVHAKKNEAYIGRIDPRIQRYARVSECGTYPDGWFDDNFGTAPGTAIEASKRTAQTRIGHRAIG